MIAVRFVKHHMQFSESELLYKTSTFITKTLITSVNFSTPAITDDRYSVVIFGRKIRCILLWHNFCLTFFTCRET